MSVTQQVVSQVGYMFSELAAENEALLEVVCQAAVSSLTARLRQPLEPEDCLADFVTAAGMFAAAALMDLGEYERIEQLTAGDLTLRRSKDNAGAENLRRQADLLMQPYLAMPFVFMGV